MQTVWLLVGEPLQVQIPLSHSEVLQAWRRRRLLGPPSLLPAAIMLPLLLLLLLPPLLLKMVTLKGQTLTGMTHHRSIKSR